MKKRVSIKDIATTVGVSTALVSYVLNGKEKEARVGHEVAKKIKKVAKDMNYHPNLIARGLKFGRTKTLGLIVADISNPFFAMLARIVENEAAIHGYTVIIGSSDEKIEKSGKLIETLLSRQVDGLMITPVDGAKSQIKNLQKKHVPFVLIDRSFSKADQNVVMIDNHDASFKAVTMLIKNGYKKIGMIAYDTKLSHMQDRIEGYRDALIENGFKSVDRRIFTVSYENTADEVKKILEKTLNPDNPDVDAFLFATNSISINALKYINRLNIKVPDKLGIVCFDESDAYDFFYSPITFVSQNLNEIGKNAVNLVIDLIENKVVNKNKIFIEADLLVTGSFGSAAGKT